MDIVNELKIKYKTGSVVFRLIFINVAVFIIVSIINLFSLFGIPQLNTEQWLAVPADLHSLIFKPWTLFTYMFLHYGFMHILFNMLWLYWFGDLFIQFIIPKRMLSVYLLGGLSGALLYILAFNVIPSFQPLVPVSIALGASASVYAIVIAVCAYIPDFEIGLLFIGRVKLKYLAIVLIVIDLFSISQGNAGGHIAHLGGALFGYIFAIQLKKGKDITKGFSVTMDYLFSLVNRKPKMRVSSSKYRAQDVSYTETYTQTKSKTDAQYNKAKAANQEEINRILDKISKSGYESLSKKEKATLFSASKK